ncbi:MAG: hypothetical protein PHQ04_11390 [Opitutaceae bacterium]|nr:hypothetical protein [Opitutaceae bacterium]
MKAVEFETEFTDRNNLPLPATVARQLPTQGRARVIVLFDAEASPRADSTVNVQFAREDTPEDIG